MQGPLRDGEHPLRNDLPVPFNKDFVLYRPVPRRPGQCQFRRWFWFWFSGTVLYLGILGLTFHSRFESRIAIAAKSVHEASAGNNFEQTLRFIYHSLKILLTVLVPLVPAAFIVLSGWLVYRMCKQVTKSGLEHSFPPNRH